ncbi:MAG: serine/threonine protein kinase, partial [Okeania sp. SIO2D1]|nr:serine/threonine protein kinase [Okeania sp. SIO2D1]
LEVRDAAITDDVVEFMTGRLQKLPAATQEVLKLAACIGNQFDLETLTVICETPSEEVASKLWSALQEGMILPLGETYKFFQGEIDSSSTEGITVNYRFLHDRVQQAAYSMIPEDTKQATHYQIGKQFLARLSTTECEERIFDIVNQINIGQGLLVEDAEKKELAELNLKAGHKAKAATAYEAAKNYFKIGISLLERNKRDSLYEIVFELHLNLAETELMTADFDALEKSISASFNLANSPVDQAKIYVIDILPTLRIARQRGILQP